MTLKKACISRIQKKSDDVILISFISLHGVLCLFSSAKSITYCYTALILASQFWG